jgi:transketolase
MTWRALEAWELLRNKGLNFKLFSVATPLEIDQKALEEASATGLILSVEDHHYHNGLGASLALAMAEGNLHGKLVPLGVRSYGASGRSEDVVAAMGLDGASIAAKAEACLKERK